MPLFQAKITFPAVADVNICKGRAILPKILFFKYYTRIGISKKMVDDSDAKKDFNN
jgi:hypothetical protein